MRFGIILIMFIMMLSLVRGMDLCESKIMPLVECKMITPDIYCTNYYYQVLDLEGMILENSTLTPLNQSNYYFVFNYDVGDYVIRLCDGTTREIQVQGEEIKMTPIAILLIGITFWLIYTAQSLNSKDEQGNPIIFNHYIKMILYTGASYLAFITLQVAYSFAIDIGLSLAIQHTLRTAYILAMWLGIIIFAIIIFGILVNIILAIHRAVTTR